MSPCFSQTKCNNSIILYSKKKKKSDDVHTIGQPIAKIYMETDDFDMFKRLKPFLTE